MPFTRDDTGLHPQTLQEIRDELGASATNPTTGIDPDLDVSDNGVFGRLFGRMADREYELQQQIVAVYNDLGIGATGQGLTRLSLITGTIRRRQIFTTTDLSLTLAPGTTVDAGAQVSDSTGSVLFATLTDAVHPGGGGNQVVVVEAKSLAPGPIVVPAATLTVIVDSVPGWVSVTNVFAGTTGAAEESDPELRLRRADELNEAATSNLDAIITEVRSTPGISLAKGYQNTSDTTDSDGLPPHSFEVVVRGVYDEDALAQTIWDNAPAGIAAVHGTAGVETTGTASDVDGQPHTITWTEAAEVSVYAHIEVSTNELYPADGDAQIVTAVTAAIESQASTIGQDILYTKLYSAVYSVPGVENVDLLALGTAPGPTVQQNVTIGSREAAVPADVTVAS